MDFDSIIVGGGSAGCVLANRLSARSNHRVLLIESGIDTPPGAVPADILDTFPTAALNPRYKWMKLLVSHQQRSNQRPMHYEQGRVMGGGSSINFQAANRGAPADYQEWCDLGADGWGWDDVLPYFRKLETDGEFAGELHGADGPLPVQRTPRAEWSGFSEAVAQAAESAGLGFLPDQNDAFADGYFPVALSNRRDGRVSVAMAYLDVTIRARANLTIWPESHVEEILFEERRAVGVRVRRGDTTDTMRGGEIILSAGALHSPAMLMRAGIGAGHVLAGLGIDVRAHRPGVGGNLREHPGTPVLAFLPRRARVAMGVRPLQVSMRMSSGRDGEVPGDMYAAVFGRAGWHGVTRRLGMVVPWVNKAYSVGRVSLASPRWEDEPTVELNLCSDARDLARLKQGVRFVGSLFAQPALRAIGAEPLPARYSERARKAMLVNRENAIAMGALGWVLDGPAPIRRWAMDKVISEGLDFRAILDDDMALEAYVRASMLGIKHVSGTCRMGRAEDPDAVTDNQGRVHGVEGLRVCDASLMPSLPRANTNLPVVMMAEKIADQKIREAVLF